MVFSTTVRKWLWLPAALGVLLAPARAQERGQEIVGKIRSVDGYELTIQRDDGPDIHIRVRPAADVRFSDAGDRKLFPEPSVRDLSPGMGVRFVYEPGPLDRIIVHYVPNEAERRADMPSLGREIKARVLAIDRKDGAIEAD